LGERLLRGLDARNTDPHVYGRREQPSSARDAHVEVVLADPHTKANLFDNGPLLARPPEFVPRSLLALEAKLPVVVRLLPILDTRSIGTNQRRRKRPCRSSASSSGDIPEHWSTPLSHTLRVNPISPM